MVTVSLLLAAGWCRPSGRIDHQDHDLRMNQTRMEFIWRASESLGPTAEVFTCVAQDGNYGPPDGNSLGQSVCVGGWREEAGVC